MIPTFAKVDATRSNKWKKFASNFEREIVEEELTRKLSQLKQLKEEFTNNLGCLRETCSVFKCGHHQNSSIAAKNTVSRVDLSVTPRHFLD